MSQACGACNKTVYTTEKVEAASKWFHKGCFKCNDSSCNIQLTLSTFSAVNDAIWCKKHAEKPKASAVADSVSLMHARHVPKKSAENLRKVQVGTGEQISYGLDAIGTQHALQAPKKTNENSGRVQKAGDFAEKINIGMDTLSLQHAVSAPHATAENLGNVQKGARHKSSHQGSSNDLAPRSAQASTRVSRTSVTRDAQPTLGQQEAARFEQEQQEQESDQEGQQQQEELEQQYNGEPVQHEELQV